ncbi:MAG: flippase [Desulfobaccales bacterium]
MDNGTGHLSESFISGVAQQLRRSLRSTVGKNAASLYIIHFANYLLPLIVVPYVVRVLNPSGYGLVAFGQSLIGYFLVFIDYGFSFSATRQISVARHDPAVVSRIIFSVWGAKLLLCVIGFLVLFSLVHLVPTLRQNRSLLFILYALALGNVLFPGWLFQGMERMVNIAVINLFIRLLVVVGIFTLIKRPEDYLWYAGLSSLGSIAAGLVGAVWAFHLFTLHPVIPSPREIWQALIEGWMLFLSMASVSLYTVGNAFILGMLTTPAVVGYYSAAEKLMKAVIGLMGPISQAAYPRFAKMAADSKELALLWARKMLLLMGGLGLVFSLVIFFSAPVIVKIFLGVNFLPSITVVRILAVLPFLVAVSNVLGVQIMFPFHYEKTVSLFVFLAGLLNLLLAFLLAPVWKANGMAVSVALCEIFVTISYFLFLYNNGFKLLSIKSSPVTGVT